MEAQDKQEVSDGKAIEGLPFTLILSSLERSLNKVTWIFIMWYSLFRLVYFLGSRSESWKLSSWASWMTQLMWLTLTAFILLIAATLVLRYWKRDLEHAIAESEKAGIRGQQPNA